MGAESDLTLKAVLEAVLDAKGFDEFKGKIEQAANDAKRAGGGAEEAGGHFDKLGKRLPNAAFDILSREMLRNAGVQQGLGPLTRVSTIALESLAAAGRLTGTALAGATLGVSLLIPLIAMLMSKSEDTAATTAQVADDTDTLVEKYESLRKKTGHLTEAQSAYLEVLKRVQQEERTAAEDTLQKEIDAEEKAAKATLGMWNATKMLVSGMIDHQIKGKAYESLEDRMFKASEKHRVEVERLTTKLGALREAHAHGAKDAGAFADKLTDAADATEEVRRRTDAQVARQVAAFWEQQARAESLAVERSRKAFLETQAAVAAGEKKNLAEAQKVIEEYAKANEQASKKILEDDLDAAKTERARRKLRLKQFETDLDAQVEAFRNAKLSEAKITEYVEREKARFARAEAAMEKELAVQKGQQYLQGANMAIGALGTIFGESKALSYAQAVINTAEGVSQALTLPFPLDFVVAALVAAAGAVQISKIQSTNKQSGGAGFDDPVNDLLARDYGRRWAADFSREVGKGFASEVGSATRGGVINQNTRVDRGTHIQNATFNGLLGTPNQAMLDLERRFIRTRRVENRTRRRSTP